MSTEPPNFIADLVRCGYAVISDDGRQIGECLALVERFYALPLRERVAARCQPPSIWGYSIDDFEFQEAVTEGLFEDASRARFVHPRPRGYSAFDFRSEESSRETDEFNDLMCGKIFPKDSLGREAEALLAQLAVTFSPYVHAAVESVSGDRPRADRAYCSARLLKYFPGARGHSKEHVDFEFLTFLCANGPGLQVLGPNGWRDVVFSESSWIVLAGESLELLTGGQIPASRHRVRLGSPRLSFPYFQGLNLDTRIEGVTFANRLREHFRRTYVHLDSPPAIEAPFNEVAK